MYKSFHIVLLLVAPGQSCPAKVRAPLGSLTPGPVSPWACLSGSARAGMLSWSATQRFC